jgi:hypothetical protein
MVGKRKLFILAIVLIPLLLGMTPLNLFNKLSGHCPFSQGKQIQRASSCLFHSIISQDDFNIPSLNSALLEKESTPSFHITAYNSTRSHISLISFPLLC